MTNGPVVAGPKSRIDMQALGALAVSAGKPNAQARCGTFVPRAALGSAPLNRQRYAIA